MQSYKNTSNNCFSHCLKSFNSKKAAITISLILSTAGLLSTGNVYAKNHATKARQELAANDTPHSTYVRTQKVIKHKSKRQDSNISDKNNDGLGGYSLQDGAREGAYGDGEYAE